MNKCLKISVVVPDAADTANITLTCDEYIQARTEAVLYISDVNKLVQDEQAILSLDDGVNTLPLEDPKGFNIRADRVVLRAANMPGGIANNPTIALRTLVATDPARIVVLTPLRRSQANRPATTAGTSTGTGINLD